MRILGTTVHVYDEDEKPHVFGPGTVVPDWAIAKITNPAVWAESAEDADPVDPTGEPSESWTVPQLREYAKGAEIDLGEASKKADILAVIKAATGQ